MNKGKVMAFRATRLPTEVVGVLDRLLILQGVTFSEYARTLILRDLDQRSVFTTQLKADLQRTQSGEHAHEAKL